MTDALGDRMKAYERCATDQRAFPLTPLYARIDGRCFHSFTKGMVRPFDASFSYVMIDVTAQLVEETGARIGYTQSDEINLVWEQQNITSELPFGGKFFKLQSLLAATASVRFFMRGMEAWGSAKMFASKPTFDCRVFSLPNRTEAANAILWRERDATKNAISMAARAHFSPPRLYGVSGDEMQEMLFQEVGINFNDYPPAFKRGTFLQRRVVAESLSADKLEKIPEQYRPEYPIERWLVREVDMPPFSKVLNREAVVFDGAEPVTA